MRAGRVSLVLCIAAVASCGGTTPVNVDSGAAAAPRASSAASAVSGDTIVSPGSTAPPATTPSLALDTAPGAEAPTTPPGGLANPTASTTNAANSTATTVGRSGPPTNPVPAPTTTPTTLTPTTLSPPTTAARPTLTASGPNGDTQVHCMGAATNAQASPTWSTTNATEVAVAIGRVADAFAAAYNLNPLRTNGSYPVPVSCAEPNPETTVTATGPGGKVTVVVTWTIHKM